MINDSMKGKRLAVFGANNVVDEVTAFARAHGVVLVSIGNVPNVPMHRISDEQYYLDCTDETAMLSLFNEKRIDGLLSCSSEMVIRKTVGFIGKTGFHYYATPEQWNVLMNKRNFKETCCRYGIPAIREYRLEDKDIAFPVIVKPVDNGGSFGITVCHNRKEMEIAVADALKCSTVGDYICEQFLQGPYFQFEIWRQNGKSFFPYSKSRLFYNAVGGAPCQPFIDHYPSPEENIIRGLYEPMSRLFDDLSIRDGSCMFQGIICDGVPYIMDTAFRLSGGMDFRVAHEDKGIDLVSCYMQHALTGRFGEDFSPLEKPLLGCYATLCVGLKNGRIGKIRGIDAVRQMPCVYSLFQYYHEGDTMQYSGRFLQVVCRIFIRAKDERELQLHVREILSLIEVYGDDGQSLLLDYPQVEGF